VGHPDRAYHSFVAGWIGGYCVWGDYSSINNQVLLYLISRIQVGLIKKVWEALHGTPHSHPESALQHPYLYPMIAASAWGVVMALFEESPHVLHPSLRSSMDEIYRYQFSFGSSFGDTTEAATSGT
jgi:peroxisomal membrane protein 4